MTKVDVVLNVFRPLEKAVCSTTRNSVEYEIRQKTGWLSYIATFVSVNRPVLQALKDKLSHD